MIRIVLLVLIIGLIVAFGVALAQFPGDITINWLGWKLETSVAFLIIGLIVLVVVVELVIRILSGVLGLPKLWGSKRREKTLRRSALAMGEIFAALRGGDADRAKRLLTDARKALSGAVGVELASATLANVTGDLTEAEQRYQALLVNPRSQAAGRRGLLSIAEAEKDTARGLALAKEAVAAGIDAPWALNALYRGLMETKAWGDALGLVDRKPMVAEALEALPVTKVRAALMLGVARGLAESGNTAQALRDAQKALDVDPDLTEAALIAARNLAASGKSKKAGQLLAAQWRRHPEPAIAEAYMGLWSGEDALKAVKHAEELAATNPDHPLSREVVAKAALDAQLWGHARTALSALNVGLATRSVCVLTARLEAGDPEGKGAEAASEWLQRAIEADVSGGHVCAACGRPHEHWDVRCGSCGNVGGIEWKTRIAAIVAQPVASSDSTAEPAKAAE